MTTPGTNTGAGPVETTRLTALPGGARLPPPGFWLITAPLGTVALAAFVTVPTTSPAPVIAVAASACGRLTTVGTETGDGPLDTARLTALPNATCVPATGAWLITDPAGTVTLDVGVTIPTVRPAPVIALVAAACVRFTTLGTIGGPDETSRLTVLPLDTLVLPAGFWLITKPAATVSLSAVVIVPTLRPATLAIVLLAAACVWPTTFGTVMPADSTMSMLVPATTWASAGGVWLITRPIGTLACGAVATPPSVSPAFVKAAAAAACVRLATSGTVASAITRSTGLPCATDVPAAGF